MPHSFSFLAERYARLGQVEARVAALHRGREVIDWTGQCTYFSEMSRLKGTLLSQQRGPMQAEAEAWFKQIIEIAQQQSAKSWELRTAASSAQLWQSRGKITEAHDLRPPINDWFTESFDTAELGTMKARLGKLV